MLFMIVLLGTFESWPHPAMRHESGASLQFPLVIAPRLYVVEHMREQGSRSEEYAWHLSGQQRAADSCNGHRHESQDEIDRHELAYGCKLPGCVGPGL